MQPQPGRSPTAERLFKGHPAIAARSAGTSPGARRRIGPADLRWADVIVVMEGKHRDRILAEHARLVEHTPIHVLEIPDADAYMAPERVDILQSSVEPLLSS